LVDWRDAAYAKILARATLPIDEAAEAAWNARPCSRFGDHGLRDTGRDLSPDADDREAFVLVLAAIKNRFPGEYYIDAKCGILFERSELMDRMTLHDHSLGIDA
jgi:hypothetical protein